MSIQLQEFIKPSRVSTNADDDSNSNSFLDFNCNIGLKARIYQRNKQLIESALITTPIIKDKKRRDSIYDLLEEFQQN